MEVKHALDKVVDVLVNRLQGLLASEGEELLDQRSGALGARLGVVKGAAKRPVVADTACTARGFLDTRCCYAAAFIEASAGTIHAWSEQGCGRHSSPAASAR